MAERLEQWINHQMHKPAVRRLCVRGAIVGFVAVAAFTPFFVFFENPESPIYAAMLVGGAVAGGVIGLVSGALIEAWRSR